MIYLPRWRCKGQLGWKVEYLRESIYTCHADYRLNTRKYIKRVPTAFGFHINIHGQLNIVANNISESNTRLKFQLNVGKQLLNKRVNIVRVIDKCRYKLNSNCRATNNVVVISSWKWKNNLREMANCTSIYLHNLSLKLQSKYFTFHFLLTVIRHRTNTQDNNPSSENVFPVWNTCQDGVFSDLVCKSNDAVNYLIIGWKEFPMKVTAPAPLHILISSSNKVILLQEHWKQTLQKSVVTNDII